LRGISFRNREALGLFKEQDKRSVLRLATTIVVTNSEQQYSDD